MTPVINNIFSRLPKTIPDELFQTLYSKGPIKIERIISQGHCSCVDQWYDQIQDEWIMLLEGQAKLQFKNELTTIILNPGDYLFIPAHAKHHVHWTDPEIKTIWLAIHIYPT